MYIQLDVSFEDSIYRFNENLADVHIQLFCYDVCYLVQDTYGVYTLYINVYWKIQCLASFPLNSQQTIAEAGFQFGCDLALAFVDNDLVLVINESQSIVTRNWFATIGNEVILLNSFRSQAENLFTINLFFRFSLLLFPPKLNIFFQLLAGVLSFFSSLMSSSPKMMVLNPIAVQSSSGFFML